MNAWDIAARACYLTERHGLHTAAHVLALIRRCGRWCECRAYEVSVEAEDILIEAGRRT